MSLTTSGSLSLPSTGLCVQQGLRKGARGVSISTICRRNPIRAPVFRAGFSVSRRFSLSFISGPIIANILASPVAAMASSADESNPQPENFAYTHLWVSADGETHIKEGKLLGFDLKTYAASTLQYVKEGPPATKLVFTELAVGNQQEWHSCPQVQFVVCLSGKWYVKTTDGTRREFGPGEILFQDDVKASPGAKQPGHQSGVVGDVPCQQLVVQVDRKPEVDNPCPSDL